MGTLLKGKEVIDVFFKFFQELVSARLQELSRMSRELNAKKR